MPWLGHGGGGGTGGLGGVTPRWWEGPPTAVSPTSGFLLGLTCGTVVGPVWLRLTRSGPRPLTQKGVPALLAVPVHTYPVTVPTGHSSASLDPKHVNTQLPMKCDRERQQLPGLSLDFQPAGHSPPTCRDTQLSGIQRDPDPETRAHVYCHRGSGGMSVSLGSETANTNITTHFLRVSP